MIESKDRQDRISKVFEELKKEDRKAFIPFITCGFPDLDGTLRIFKVLETLKFKNRKSYNFNRNRGSRFCHFLLFFV